MNSTRIRGFLLVHPKPAAVRVSSEDGETQVLKPGKSFARCADTIAALAPELLECLDAQGSVTRAMRMDSPEARRSEAAEIPEGLKADPHALMLTHFADLLHRAYEHSTEIAFNRLADFVSMQNERSASIESRLERQEAINRKQWLDQLDMTLEHAEERNEQAAAEAARGGFGDEMLRTFLASKANAATSGPGPTKTNGSSRSNGKHPKGEA